MQNHGGCATASGSSRPNAETRALEKPMKALTATRAMLMPVSMLLMRTECSLATPASASCAVRPASTNRFDVRREDVTGAALGADQHAALVVAFDLSAKPSDLDIDGAVVDLVVVKA